jgi:DNA-binding CsgD family transcriptional regulator/GAF domain-containing protein
MTVAWTGDGDLATVDELVARVRADERVRDACDRLVRVGPVSEILERGTIEAATAAVLDRLVLSRIEDGALIAERVHVGPGFGDAGAVLAELRRSPVRLAYPVVECELLRRRQAQIVVDIDERQPGRYAFFTTLGWRKYLAAPILVEERVVGFLHGDRGPDGPPVGPLDVRTLEEFAAVFALVFERAVLRRRLRDQRREIQRVATWAEIRASALADGAISLSLDQTTEDDSRAGARPELVTDDGLGPHLTSREMDVLKLMALGKTNSEIARALIVTEGTVKFHVKNILRKLQVSNRAEATSRYLRLTLSSDP